MNILIVTGGSSSERKISVASAKAVKEACKENSFKAKLFDLKKGYRQLKEVAYHFDLIFPVLHGEEGEGGTLQKFLLSLKRPFIGGSWKGYRTGWYKIAFKKYCDKNQLPTAKWKIIKDVPDIIKFGFPSVLKTSNGGSSREVAILQNEKDLKKPIVKHILSLSQPVFVEQFVEGVEITVAVLNGEALPVVEIIPPEGKWFDYQSKYSGATRELPNAPSLNSSIRRHAQLLAEKIHKDHSLGHMSRIDMIVKNNQIFLLEVNTIPGMTAESLLPKAAQAAGLSFSKLIKKLIYLSADK